MLDGIAFVVYGDKAEREYQGALEALRVSGNQYDIKKIGLDLGAVNDKQASRYAKTRILSLVDYDRICYLDADTRVRDSLQVGFDILADGWDMVMTPSTNQGQEVFWHVSEPERQTTLETIGYIPLQLQCGVMWIDRNERTERFYRDWWDEYLRFGAEDQAAFIRALNRVPLKIWLLGKPWNGGAAIDHRFGMTR